MKRQIIAALCLCMAGIAAADAGDAFLLQTRNTTLALRRQHGAWNVAQVLSPSGRYNVTRV